MNKKIMYYTPQISAKTSKLKSLAERMSIELILLSTKELDETVGYLAGIPGFLPAPKILMPMGLKKSAPFIGELMILHNFTSEGLDAFLKALRQSDISPVALKAIVTESNQSWTVRALYEELKQEHAYMHR